MNITILDNRDVIINSSDNLGTQNENNASIINFSFPESLMNANKKIVFITDDGNYWDLITNNSYKITNAVSKYKNVSVYVWLVDEQNDIDFRSKIWNVSFNKNEEPDDIVPTEEEISGFDTMITQLNQGLEELDEEKIKLRREYEKVEEGLEDLDEALIQVNNVDIDASKTGNVATITITNKEGTEKPVQISDGTDYVITQEDYQAIANVVEQDIADEIPKKTSDLENDSGFIDNTVNNLTNYTLKTNTGSLIDLEINSTTYVITLRLKDVDGNVISTDTVDLPLESVVVGGSYDSVNKKIVLTLENGNTVDILVGDLIAGLQTEITNNNKLASDLVDDTNSGNKFVTTSEKQTWNGKYNKPVGGIPKTDLSSAVQTSLGKADSALQEHQDISGKEDKTNKVTSIDENSTDTQYPSAKLLYDELVEKQTEIDGLVAENTAMKKQIPTAHISTTSTQLTNSADGLPVEHVKIKGATSQVQYEGYNLLNLYDTKTITYKDVNFKVTDQVVILDGTSTGGVNQELCTLDYELEANQTYTAVVISEGTSNGGNNVAMLIGNNQVTNMISITTNPSEGTRIKTYTPTENKTINRFSAYIGDTGVQVNLKVKVMLLKGAYTLETIPSYEPYVGGQPAPNPAYPQLIHRVTGDCGSKFQNKNLFDTNKNPKVLNASIEENIDTGKRLVNTTANTSYTYGIYSLMDLSNYVGKTVRIKANIQASAENIGGYVIGLSDSNANNRIQKAYTSVSGSELAFVVPNLTGTVTYLYLVLYSNTGGNAQAQDYVDYTDIVITIDNEDMTYIPHAEQNAPLSLGNIEAYEGDEIQIDYVQKAGNKKVTGARLVQNNAKIASYNGETITTEYKSTTGQLTTGATVVYKLATPVITPITDQTLLAQLETLINMKTYKEVTNIDLTGEDLTPVLDCDYYQDMSTIKSRIFSYDSATQTLTITI